MRRQLPPPGAGPGADRLIQRALDQAAPADLPPATAHKVAELGRQVWTAEATGSGRTRWPGYFPTQATGRSTAYTRFRIQAVTAHRDGSDSRRVVVRVVWAGADPAGNFLDGRNAILTFTQNGADAWTPTR